MPAVTSCMSLEQPVEVTSHVRCSECAAVQTWIFFLRQVRHQIAKRPRLQNGGGAIHVDRLIWLNESGNPQYMNLAQHHCA